MQEPLAELEGVTKRFGRVPALSELSLRIEPGVSYGLIGRNGAGKTTALRLLMGLLRPDEGKVKLFGGDPIADAERVKLHVGYLAEDQAFPPRLRPLDLVGFFAGCYPSWDHEFAASLVARFKIPLKRRLSTLSKGQQRQVGLLCAVAHRPRLLILDEPGGGLDPVVRRGFLEEVIDLLGSEQTSVLFSSHHLGEVERIATRIGILHRGGLLIEEDMDRLRERSCQVLARLNGADVAAPRLGLPGCVQAKPKGEAWLLTFLTDGRAACERVGSLPGGEVIEARAVSLEDLFVAMVGEGG